jgi:hypothetical protein
MRKRNRVGIVLLVLASAVAVAETRYLSNAPGTWKQWRFTAYADQQRDLGAKPGDMMELEAQLLKLNAILRKTEGLTNPVGFSVETVGGLEFEPKLPRAGAGDPGPRARPFPSSLNFGAYAIMEFGSGANARRDDSGETAQVLFYVNMLSQPLNSGADTRVPEFETLDVDVVRLVPPQPDVMGFQRYGDTLVLKKSPEPIWAAVTMGETLDLAAQAIEARLVGERDAVARLRAVYDESKDPNKREQRMAQYRKIAPLQKDPAYMDKMAKVEATREKQADALMPQIAAAQAVVGKSEQELSGARSMAAGQSAADKAAPACYSIDKVALARFRPAPATACDPLVRPNWKLFNRALPRTAPQVLTIWNFTQCLDENNKSIHVGGCVANRRLIQSMDKAALLAWLQ